MGFNCRNPNLILPTVCVCGCGCNPGLWNSATLDRCEWPPCSGLLNHFSEPNFFELPFANDLFYRAVLYNPPPFSCPLSHKCFNWPFSDVPMLWPLFILIILDRAAYGAFLIL